MALIKPEWGVRDHETDTVQAAVDQAAEELGPEGLVLAIADVDAEDLAVPVGAAARGDHHRTRHDLAVVADVDVGRVEPHVHERLVIQPAVAQHGDVVVDRLADPAHGRLGHARVAAECFDQIVDLADRGAGDVGGHDHRPQRLVDPPARLEQLREEAAASQLGDRDLDVTRAGRHQLGAVSVAQIRAQRGPLTRLRADPSGQLGLDQLLDRGLHNRRDRRRQRRITRDHLIGQLV